MGVNDNDIDKIQETGISNSAQYKLAGNSIVVDVLYHIFRKMLIEKDSEESQKTLF
jgi:site-specific DNA-cytosine methylase